LMKKIVVHDEILAWVGEGVRSCIST